MDDVIKLSDYSDLDLLGTRFIARKIRGSIEQVLLDGNAILDFGGIEVTQSFIDELVGPLVLISGPDLLRRVAFRGCTENAQTIIRFVISSRLADYTQRKDATGAPRPESATA